MRNEQSEQTSTVVYGSNFRIGTLACFMFILTETRIVITSNLEIRNAMFLGECFHVTYKSKQYSATMVHDGVHFPCTNSHSQYYVTLL